MSRNYYWATSPISILPNTAWCVEGGIWFWMTVSNPKDKFDATYARDPAILAYNYKPVPKLFLTLLGRDTRLYGRGTG